MYDTLNARKKDRETIQAQVNDFFKKGGAVKVVPAGESDDVKKRGGKK